MRIISRINLFFIIFFFLFQSAIVIGFGSEEGIIINPAPQKNVFRLKSFSDTFKVQLDPVNSDSSIFVSEQIFDGLVRLENRNNNFDIVPALAEYWESSPDGKRYRFYLRKGVKFHHGEELTAHDVKFSLERLLDPEVNSPYYQFLATRIAGASDFHAGRTKGISGIKVIDELTIEILWKKPLTLSLYLMSMHFCKILPRELVLEQGKDFFRRPSGTGPFKFDSWIRDTRLKICGVRMIRNKQYFQGTPRLEVVEFCPLYTLEHFLNGEIDSIPVLSDKLLKSDFIIFEDGSLHPVYLGMSCHIPPLNDIILRRAIFYGINKSELIQETHEARYKRELLYSFIPPKLPGLFLADDRTTYYPERAKNILKGGGFSPNKEIPPITLFLSHPRNEFKIKLFRELKKQLSILGISLKVDYYRSNKEIKDCRKPYLILMDKLMHFPDPDNIIRPLFYSKSEANLCGYVNSELDNLLSQTEIEPSWTRRNKLFHRIQLILNSEIPAVPLYSQQNRVAMQQRIKGIEIPPMGLHYLRTFKIWFENEK